MPIITYRIGNDLDIDAVIALYIASTLRQRRPVTDKDRMAAMLANASLVIAAWDGNLLVGISRALSDFAYVTYLSDLAVRVSHQRMGIGKALVQRTRQAAPRTKIVLLAAPAAVDYYPHIGFQHHPHAWLWEPGG